MSKGHILSYGKKVLIMLATYNGERFIEQQIESILKQTYTNFHLAIQDDGSTDATLDIIKKYSQKDKRIEILKNESKYHGPFYNFHCLANKFKQREKYDFYMFCDQDDLWDQNKIEKYIHIVKNKFKNFDKPVLVYSDMRLIDEVGNVKGVSVDKIQGIKYVNKHSVFFAHNVYGCNLMMNYQCFLAVPILDLSKPIVKILSHDNLYTKFAAYLGAIYYIPSVSMSYRRFGGNVTGAQAYDFKLKRILKRLSNLSLLAKDHSRAYSQTLYTIELLTHNYPTMDSIDLEEMKKAIYKGGIYSLLYIKKYNVNWGRTIKNLSRKIILVTKLYQKYLVCDFEHKLLYF